MTISRDQGVLAAIGSPVLLPPDAVDAARPWRWTTVAIAVAVAVLIAFNAHAAQAWFDELTPGPASEPLRAPIAALTRATAPFDGARARLAGLWDRARAARFGHEQPGEQGATAGE